MVERGVALLMDEAPETKQSAPSDVVLDYTLVERASTAPWKPHITRREIMCIRHRVIATLAAVYGG